MPFFGKKRATDFADCGQRNPDSLNTLSALGPQAVESEITGDHGETFGNKFGHLFGVAKQLPTDASCWEA